MRRCRESRWSRRSRRRTGVLEAERELEASADALARSASAADRYSVALERFLALGGADFHARARTACTELGLGVDLDRGLEGVSGGEAARVALAAILLSRFDVLLLDEPTNDLDFDGLERLEGFLETYRGALVVVVPRPGVPRSDRRPDRGDRAGHTARPRVGRRLERLRVRP